jgi:hypothetical protein
MKKPDTDRYQLWLTDFLQTTIGKPAATGVRVIFPHVNGSQVGRVDVRAAGSTGVRAPTRRPESRVLELHRLPDNTKPSVN